MFFRKAPKKTKEIMFEQKADLEGMELTTANLKTVLGGSKDIVFRSLEINALNRIPLTIIYTDGLVDSDSIANFIIKPLAENRAFTQVRSAKEAIREIDKGAVYYPDQKTRDQIGEVIDDILSGATALVFESEKKALVFEAKNFAKRAVTPPIEESALKGPKDCFVETFRDNTAMVRRKIRTPDLVIDETTIGRQTRTTVGIFYIKGIASQKIVSEVRKRLNSIDIDGLLYVANLEEHFIDSKYTPFPQISFTEKPDKFCSNLVEGRVGMIIDGYPFSLIVPVTFVDTLQVMDDYNFNVFMASGYRLLRWVLYFVTLFLPGFYVAVTTFHQEMIPTNLVLSIAESKTGTPFPIFIEVLLAIAAFNILLQAGVGVWKTIGNTVSIVGALVLGEAAITASLISPGVVIVVAVAAISTLAIPSFELTTAAMIWQLIITVFCSFFGLYGLVLASLILLYNLCTIEVLGVPYLSPLVSSEGKDMQDSLFRLPVRTMKQRPGYLKPENQKKQ